MELKPKYQYTYFIKPFIIEQENYKKYLIKMLKDKKFSLKIWEKERDFNMYDYFLPEIRNKLFYGFKDSKEQIEKFKNLNIQQQVAELQQKSCVQFSYKLNEDTPGKIGEEDGVFFGINKIEVICFNTGVCFLLLKTCIESTKEFSEILNFNYKFREYNSKYSNLKEYEKIHIQTNVFNNGQDLNHLIQEITCNTDNSKDILEDDKFYVYSYTCVDGEGWNDKITFNDIQAEFWKYSNVLPSNYNVDMNFKETEEMIGDWQYAKLGFNKSTSVLLSSSLNAYHYTKLPFEYENQYLYTYILALYQNCYFKKLINDFKNNKNVSKTRKRLNDFIKKMLIKEVTRDDLGTKLYKKWEETLELENLYLETMNIYDVALKEKKGNGIVSTRAMWLIIAMCVMLNIANTIIFLNL